MSKVTQESVHFDPTFLLAHTIAYIHIHICIANETIGYSVQFCTIVDCTALEESLYCISQQKHHFLERAVGIAVGRHSAGYLETIIVAPISVIISPFFTIVYFSHRRSAQIKKTIQLKLTRSPKNLGLHAVQRVTECPRHRRLVLLLVDH